MAAAVFVSCQGAQAEEDGARLGAQGFRGLRVGPASSAGGEAAAAFSLAQLLEEGRTSPEPSALPVQDEGPGAISQDDDSRRTSWSLAPVRWDGKLSSELRVTGISGVQRRTQRVDSAEANARSYIWQPWFIQLRGGLGILRSHQLSSHTKGSAAQAAPQGDSGALTGHGMLVVFPMSRFPFQARAERTDSRTSGAVTAQDYTTTRVGVRQDYRANGSTTNYWVSADRSVVESAFSGRDTLDVWEAHMAGQSGPQSYDLLAQRSRNSRDQGGESDIGRLMFRHSYQEGASLTVSNLASADDSTSRGLGTLSPADNRTRSVQLNSQATWRPAADSPWYVSGGARLFRTAVENQGVATESRTSTANIGANYRVNHTVSLTGSASVTEVLTDTRRDVLSSISSGITYTPVAIPVGPYLYNRGLGATASRRTGGPQGNVNTASAQFDHGLTRSIAIDRASTVGINLGQGISVLDDTSSGRTEALSHTAGVSWSVSPSENSRAYSALSAADTRRRGATDSDFQLVNLQVSGQYQFSRFAFGSANFTTQASRSGGELASTDGYDTRSTGNLGYQHGRAFGVPGLSYSVLYSVNESQFATRQQGDLEAPPHQASQSLEQRLDYRIGLLETRLLARVAETEGLRDWLIFLRVTRRFGTY